MQREEFHSFLQQPLYRHVRHQTAINHIIQVILESNESKKWVSSILVSAFVQRAARYKVSLVRTSIRVSETVL